MPSSFVTISPGPEPRYPGRIPTAIRPGIAALILTLGLASLAACSSGSGTSAQAGIAPAAGPPRTGGTLTVDIAGKPLCLDPQNNNSNGNTAISRQLVDSLTDQDPITGQARPWLAASFQADATATTFTFKLRPGATFSDGAAVDAAAVKTNFDSIVKLGAVDAVGSSYLADYTGTTVVDPSTATVSFSHPNAQFLQATSTAALGLLSPASLATAPQDRCQGNGLAGSGPFVVKDPGQGQEIKLAGRKGYSWGSSLWKHQGAAYLAEIDYRVVPESAVRAGSLASGQVDGVIGVDPQDEQTLTRAGVGELARSVPGIAYNLTANTTHPVLADAAVRTAITKGIDRAQIVSTLLSSHYKPATSILSSITPFYTDLSSDLAHDPTGAGALLDAAGWTVGGDGIRTKGGVRLKVQVVYPAVDTTSRNVLQLVQQQLAKIGVDAELDGLPLNQLAPAQNAGQYDLLWFGLTRADPDILRTAYPVSAKNRAHLPAGNPLETALGDQAATVDPTQRKALTATAQQLIVRDAYAIPVYEQIQFDAFAAKVRGAALDGSAQPELFDTWRSQ